MEGLILMTIFVLMGFALLILLAMGICLVVEWRTKTITGYRTSYHIFWGLRVHKYYRGDRDDAPHDHPWDFITFPLCSYLEYYLDDEGQERARIVKGFRFHFRKAEFTHRLIARAYPEKDGHVIRVPDAPFFTVVWEFRNRRSWGFWPISVLAPDAAWLSENDPLYQQQNKTRFFGGRRFVPMEVYLNGRPYETR